MKSRNAGKRFVLNHVESKMSELMTFIFITITVDDILDTTISFDICFGRRIIVLGLP